MKKNGIKSERKTKWKATTNSKHNLPVAPNILEQNFNANDPNTVWVGDITYNWTEEGWLYTAIVKDLCTKEVVGYAMGDRITKELVIKAMKKAIRKEKPKSGLIFHSDRGSQYCSNDFKDMLKVNHIRQSMSRKGNPYDNACAENFFSCLKCECTNFYYFRNRDEAKQTIFEYIEVYYNRQRRHAALGWIAPIVYKKIPSSNLAA
jgi:putative transposase